MGLRKTGIDGEKRVTQGGDGDYDPRDRRGGTKGLEGEMRNSKSEAEGGIMGG